MDKNVGIAVAVGIVVIVSVIAYQLNETSYKMSTPEEYYENLGRVSHVVHPDNPQFLGPLQINKDKYLLGENVYLILTDLIPTDKGKVLFFSPEGKKYFELAFDGSKSDMKKAYFKPQLLKGLDLCKVEQLVGTWTVAFAGYEQYKLSFEMEDAFLPNNEQFFIECSDPVEMTEEMLSEVEKVIEEQRNP